MTVIDILLKKRGLNTRSQIQSFFHPENPLKIDLAKAGIEIESARKTVNVVTQAIKNQQPIYIFGDFDADGITATAVLWETLFKLKAKVLPHIGGRNDPVRGLSVSGIKEFKPNSLVITVDNGVTSFEAADYAQKNNIDLIITDHHQPRRDNGQAQWPKAKAIFHTDQLAGVGVAWFLAREVLKHLQGERSSHLGGDVLDLVALGTIADMVPLLNTNRSLVKFGMEKLKTSPRPGIKILASQAMIELDKLTPHQVSFSLAPRLNAMGRLDNSLDALRLLCTFDSIRAESLGVRFNEVNQMRQDQTLSMFSDAKIRAKKCLDKPLIFIQSETYHEGLVGLVAGRLVEEFHRPAVVVAIGPNHAKGSIRSDKNFDAIKTIRSLEKLVMEHGGHPQAAGFTAAVDKLPEIQKQLEQAAAKITPTEAGQEVVFDCELDLKQVNWEFYNELEKFAPFGFGNPVPVFKSEQVKLQSFYPVGQENKHLKLRLDKFSAIAFGKGQLAAKLQPGQLVDITYSLEANNWNNRNSLELKVKDITV